MRASPRFVAVALIATAALLATVSPAIATALGVIVALGSVVVFGWAVIGLAGPRLVGLPGRWHAVGLWVASVIMFFVGAAMLPDEPPPTVAGLEVVAEEPELAAAEEHEPAVALAKTAATQPDPALVPERAELPSPQPPEPTEQKLAALDRLNAASDRVDAVMSEINRKCAPPASRTAATAYAKCIARFLVTVCPDIGEGALSDMSKAARDMDAPEAAGLLEQAALDCWTAVFYGDMPSGGTMPRYVGEAVTRMGEKFGEASAMLR